MRKRTCGDGPCFCSIIKNKKKMIKRMKNKKFKHRKKRALRLVAVTSIMTSLAALAAMPTGKFLREMPKATNEEPTNPSYEEMLATFKNPFGKVKTGTYWYWISGNFSC